MTKRRIIRSLALVSGICLCAYPLVASLMGQRSQSKVISTYKNKVESCDEGMVKQILEAAEEYNEALYRTQGSIVSSWSGGSLDLDNYEQLLNISGSGVMGSVEIPKISVHLPIYHGTGEDVLSVGVGHLEGSSLPVGGNNTHCILTGHRGLPNSKLFTRLDELKTGDLFYIEVGNQILAYKVSEIQVIKPEDTSGLSIRLDRDLVSLVTCTPYGVNSHRLVVTGERTQYRETGHLQIKPQLASGREILFAILPFGMVGVCVVKIVKERRGRVREA